MICTTFFLRINLRELERNCRGTSVISSLCFNVSGDHRSTATWDNEHDFISLKVSHLKMGYLWRDRCWQYCDAIWTITPKADAWVFPFQCPDHPFCRIWDSESKKATRELKKPSLSRVLIKCYGKDYAVTGLFVFSLVNSWRYLVW